MEIGQVCRYHHDMVKSVQKTEDMVQFLFNEKKEEKDIKEKKKKTTHKLVGWSIKTLISLVSVLLAAATTYAALK